MQLEKNDKLYYARILPSVEVYEICELIIRTVSDTWFVGIDDKDKHAYLFSYKDIGKIVFFKRTEALSSVIRMERKYSGEKSEIFYEEY